MHSVRIKRVNVVAVKDLPELGRDPLSEDAFLPLRLLCKPKQPPILFEGALDAWQPYI